MNTQHYVITITNHDGMRIRWWFAERLYAMRWAANWLVTWREPVIIPSMARYAIKEKLIHEMDQTNKVVYDGQTAELGSCACLFSPEIHNDCVRWAYNIRRQTGLGE